MRNLRRLILTEDFIATHHLSTEPPPPDSLFWTMWNTWLSVAKEALATGFVQSIKNGTLDPTVYGSFNVSDPIIASMVPRTTIPQPTTPRIRY